MKYDQFSNKKTISKIEADFVFSLLNPMSEPGILKLMNLKPFKPSEEDFLKKEWEKISTIIPFCTKGNLPLDVKIALKNIKKIDVFEKHHTEWGKVELFQIYKILNSISTLYDFINKNKIKLFEKPEFTFDLIIKKLVLHISSDTFYLNHNIFPELKTLRFQLKTSEENYNNIEKTERKKIAKQLKVNASQLKSGIIIKSDEQQLFELLESIPQMYLFESKGDELRYRYKSIGEAAKLKIETEKVRNKLLEVENSIIKKIAEDLKFLPSSIKPYLDFVGDIDLTFAKSVFSIKYKCIKPDFSDEITLYKVRHPKIEQSVHHTKQDYQSISTILKSEVINLVGSNMGGKTSFLKTLGLLQVMFQFGLFIPGKHFKSKLFGSVLWGGTTEDNLSKGLSGFGAEINDIMEALQYNKPIMLLLDEFGRSTNFEEGKALSLAFADYFHSFQKGILIFAGHLGELGQHSNIQSLRTKGLDKLKLEKEIKKSKNKIAILKNCMNYDVEEGNFISSDAIVVAEFLGLPKEIIDKAQNYLRK